jgi:hypothetical protein
MRILTLLAVLVTILSLGANALAQAQTSRSPGFIVVTPSGLTTVSAEFVLTDNIYIGSVFKAVATGPMEETVILRQFQVPQSYYGVQSWGFPLAGNFDGLPVKFLPVGSKIRVIIEEPAPILPILAGNTQVGVGDEKIEKTVTTALFIWGGRVSQGADQITLYGTFNPEVPTEVFVGLWHEAVKPEAVMVLPDRIVLDLTKDKQVASWMPGFYPLTVRQGNVCDSILIRFLPPDRHESNVLSR